MARATLLELQPLQPGHASAFLVLYSSTWLPIPVFLGLHTLPLSDSIGSPRLLLDGPHSGVFDTEYSRSKRREDPLMRSGCRKVPCARCSWGGQGSDGFFKAVTWLQCPLKFFKIIAGPREF